MHTVKVDDRDAALMFKALGDPTRLRIFKFLQSCAEQVALEEGGEVHPLQGPTVGEVCCHLTGVEKITSTVSFHLKELRNAGLIAMEKQGKYMICCVEKEAMQKLRSYLTQGCCCEEPKNVK